MGGCTGMSERAFTWNVNAYGRTLSFVLRHPGPTLAVLLATIGLNVYLFIHVPKGFFPQQDNGRMMGAIMADQDTSFQAMDKLLLQMVKIVAADPAVDTVNGFTGGGWSGSANTARMFISLKPLADRKITADLIIARLRPKLGRVPGATLYLQASQDVRVGGRMSSALYQYTMRGDNLQDLIDYAPRMLQELKTVPIIADVNSDQQDRGLQSLVTYDRPTAARFGISSQLIDSTLYDAFGQRQVSTMYKAINQYHVVMEAAPRILAGSAIPEAGVRALPRRTAGAAQRFRQIRAHHRSFGRDASGSVSRRHHLLQPAAGHRSRGRGGSDRRGGF